MTRGSATRATTKALQTNGCAPGARHDRATVQEHSGALTATTRTVNGEARMP